MHFGLLRNATLLCSVYRPPSCLNEQQHGPVIVYRAVPAFRYQISNRRRIRREVVHSSIITNNTQQNADYILCIRVGIGN